MIKIATIDVRFWQLGIMASLLLSGVLIRDFSLLPAQIILTFIGGLLTQALFLKILKISTSSYLSTVITCFGLCLLLRCANLWVHPVVISLAIASKFFIRPFGRHLFNPANLGVIIGLVFFPETWITSGQWGADLTTALWMIGAGFFIAKNAQRLDITLYFLISYAMLFLGIRVFWYGYNLEVFLHQFQNGALILFAFFMISDPMTIPHHQIGRLIHAVIVAIFAYLWQYYLYWDQGIIWGLFFATFLVPLWNYLFPASAYQWQSHSGNKHA
ncbi:MAG: RnfABCDGE type electron transport complex subunit D [Methylococcales bacterium]|nr:RnfABCDGE type electron transport complex subunit D [Methylococcales bacterium]